MNGRKKIDYLNHKAKIAVKRNSNDKMESFRHEEEQVVVDNGTRTFHESDFIAQVNKLDIKKDFFWTK